MTDEQLRLLERAAEDDPNDTEAILALAVARDQRGLCIGCAKNWLGRGRLDEEAGRRICWTCYLNRSVGALLIAANREIFMIIGPERGSNEPIQPLHPHNAIRELLLKRRWPGKSCGQLIRRRMVRTNEDACFAALAYRDGDGDVALGLGVARAVMSDDDILEAIWPELKGKPEIHDGAVVVLAGTRRPAMTDTYHERLRRWADAPGGTASSSTRRIKAPKPAWLGWLSEARDRLIRDRLLANNKTPR